MPEFMDDPTVEVKKRIAEIDRPKVDEKESAEREEAAVRYAGELPQHYVDYCEDCIKASVSAMTEIRRNQAECWRVYQEDVPDFYSRKEDWQSKVVLPQPFGAVQFAMAVVRKAFDVDFLSVDKKSDEEAAVFWESLMRTMLSQAFADFPINFTDASGMSFAVGQSLEMLPVWRPGRGLRFVNVEPWKIHRDPDAISRQPQSGMYWIHQEYIDYWLLRKYQEDGRYMNIDESFRGGGEGDAKTDANMTKTELANRRGMISRRSQFRSSILTSEFWGTILSPSGELLMDNATYTIANGKLVQAPKKSSYPSLRWPGISFSVLPNFLRFDGRGIVQGIKSLWYFMSSLLCLHADNLNWTVNPPVEIDVSSLVDPTDVDDYPNKRWLTRGTVSGQQCVRTIDRRSSTNDILANLNFAKMSFQEGTFVNNFVQGLPGYRAEVTAREASQNLEQSMTVFSLIGKNLEHGALSVIRAAAEVVKANLSYKELVQWMGKEVADKYADLSSPTGLRLPELTTGGFHVSGVSALMRDWEVIDAIRTVILPLFEGGAAGLFVPYLKPYQLLRSLESRLNLRDEGILIDPKLADAIDKAQQQNQNQQIALQGINDQVAVAQGVQGLIPPEVPPEEQPVQVETVNPDEPLVNGDIG